jgi:TolB-like protein/Tfp pilus assembly protein PilF
LQLLAELRRRNVIRIAGLYLVGAWLLVQVAETVLPVFGVPDWVLRALIILLALGFVPALVFSWVFELTPDGLRRESELDRSRSSVDHTARKLDLAVIVLLLAVGAMVLFKPAPEPPPVASAQDPQAAAAMATEAEAAGPAAASIAVLPFADLSQAGDQGYFSDGMSEEILNVLAKVEGLQVASRTSSFAFKGQETLGVPAIAEQLGVRHVLEGSVRRAGDTLRITAQLIDAQTDRHLWSETFDRPLTAENVFAIQDEISKAIVAALVKALPSAEVGAVGQAQTTTNLSAYDNYLRARTLVRSRRQLLLAEQLLEKSLEQDPQYAPAWELRAALQPLLGEYTDTPLTLGELDRLGTEYAERALSLAPDSALALAVKANIRGLAAQSLRARHDLGEVIGDLERSLEIDPSSTNAMNWLGMTLGLVGRLDDALAAYQRCVQVDPLASACSENEYDTLYSLGRHDEAWQRYLDALDRGAVTDQWTNFQMLARFEQKAAFLFASNQSKYLPRWHRHQALYEAHRNLDADHGPLLREIRAFAEQEDIALDNGFVTMLLTPLGAYELKPFAQMSWGEDYRRYRQSPEFKHRIRESGVYDYWRKKGFPANCQPVEPDDFRCD